MYPCEQFNACSNIALLNRTTPFCSTVTPVNQNVPRITKSLSPRLSTRPERDLFRIKSAYRQYPWEVLKIFRHMHLSVSC